MRKITKTHWGAVKHYVKNTNLAFYDLIESVAPSKELSLYLAEYNFADLLAAQNKVYLPDDQQRLYILGSKESPNEITRELGYGKNSMPLGIILDKSCEWFYEDNMAQTKYPFALQNAGSIFNQQIIFDEEESIENNTLSVASGAKSAFMLPYIGSQSQHDRMKACLNIKAAAPKSSSEHLNVFIEIIKNHTSQPLWTSKILYFSIDWVSNIRNRQDWLPIKYFFSENLRRRHANDLYNNFYNDLFLSTASINRFRPTPYLVDTAKHIFNISMGQGLGFRPAVDDHCLPIHLIQETYKEHYQLPYTPTIMIPGSLKPEKQSNECVYYSLQQPSTKINSFKITMNNSAYRELVALKGIIDSYKKCFLNYNGLCYGSDLYHACKQVTLDFFHNKPSDTTEGIECSKKLIEKDESFLFSARENSLFSADAKFLRGCIRIARDTSQLE